MIRQLRKRHLQIWTAWAVLLPVGIITAYTSITKPAVGQLLQPAVVLPLPIEINKIEKGNYTVMLRSNVEGSQLQLEWVNKNILTVPTATIYQSVTDDITKGKLIGRIEARGTYRFTVDTGFLENNNKLLVYDFIRKHIVDSIKF
ncbi:MAG: hypothetical protein ABIN01_22575 [Ferruginibacter sp.]